MPADALLHPLVLLAIAALIVNDHVGKGLYPGLVTGKLSDVAGLAFFPLVLVGAVEVARAVVGRWTGPSVLELRLAIVATALSFAAVKTVPAAAFAFGWCTGAAGWAIAVAASVGGGPAPTMIVGLVRVDPTDLVALPALALPWLVGRRRLSAAVVPASGAEPATPHPADQDR